MTHHRQREISKSKLLVIEQRHAWKFEDSVALSLLYRLPYSTHLETQPILLDSERITCQLRWRTERACHASGKRALQNSPAFSESALHEMTDQHVVAMDTEPGFVFFVFSLDSVVLLLLPWN